MSTEEYLNIEFARARKNLHNKERAAFGSRDNLATWFVEKLKSQNFCCYYCRTSIFDINKLINANLLKTRAVRGDGCRGPVLEIDKNDNTYVPDNCVLSCYYCNNDKSYTSTMKDYKEYFGENRHRYFEILLKKLHNN